MSIETENTAVENNDDLWSITHTGSYGSSSAKSVSLLLQDRVYRSISELRAMRPDIMEKMVTREYKAEDGKTITRDSVDTKLSEHFELEAGVADEYLEKIIKLDEQTKSDFAVMKLSNLDLKKRIEDALADNENRRDPEIQSLGKVLAKATIEFLQFMIKHEIPFVIEMSSEIGVQNYLHTYSGGLGVLSGDKHKALADLGVPAITFAILPEHGYGGQQIDFRSKSVISPKDKWDPVKCPFLFEFNDKVEIPIAEGLGEGALANAYCYGYIGRSGMINPVIYLSTYHTKQNKMIRDITDELYPSGALKLASQYSLAYLMEIFTEKRSIQKTLINLNEGHTALVPVVMMRKYLEEKGIELTDSSELDKVVEANRAIFLEALLWVRSKIAFVTHTKDSSAFDRYTEYDAQLVMDPKDLNLIFALCNKSFPKYNGVINREEVKNVLGDDFDALMKKDIFKSPDQELMFVDPDLSTLKIINRISSVVGEGPKLEQFMDILSRSKVQFEGWGRLYADSQAHGIIMAPLAMFFAGSANSVAAIHKEVTDTQVFPHPADKARMHNVTNAIHAGTWWDKALDFQERMKEFIGDTKKKYMEGFKIMIMKDLKPFQNLVSDYHLMEKMDTIDYVNKLVEDQFGPENFVTADHIQNTFLVVFARRAKGYKLNDLLVMDEVVSGYSEIAKTLKEDQKIVIVVAGKAHPKDAEGQGYVKHIIGKQQKIFDDTNEKVVIVYKENYDMADGRMFSRFDLCIANPVVGWEASGTSPMKNPLRLIMHTYDGFFAEFNTLAKKIYGINDASWGFGSKKVEEVYDRPGLKREYAVAFKETFAKVTGAFFNEKDVWIKKQIEQLTIFTTAFQMERFAENYITIWKKYVRNVAKLFAD